MTAVVRTLRWRRGRTDYYIEAKGERYTFSVAKVTIDGVDKYALMSDKVNGILKFTILGYFADSIEARDKAEAHV